MTENNLQSIGELTNKVLVQLKEQNYMDSSLANYSRLYRRVITFMDERGFTEYTPTVGQEFLDNQNLKSLSAYSFYSCAIRRLNDCLDGKEYQNHHLGQTERICSAYEKLLDTYLNNCEQKGNKPATICHKKFACIKFLNFLMNHGYEDISKINSDIILKALLIFNNKDNYGDVRNFLRYLYDKKLISMNYAEIIPSVKKKRPVPTVYSIEEIQQIENSIDASTDTGLRNLSIIRLATRMGLRSGDIANLKISEIDFTLAQLNIIQEKTGVPLELEIPLDVYEPLLAHIENQKKKNYSDEFVFHSMTAPYGKISTSIIRHLVNGCMEAAGIEINGRRHGPHSFRSSLASSMINDNASYETVRKILGHSDPDIIKHYAKVDIEQLRLCAIDPPKPTGLFDEYLSGKKVFKHV
jgi:site-specific recombinase XerD